MKTTIQKCAFCGCENEHLDFIDSQLYSNICICKDCARNISDVYNFLNGLDKEANTSVKAKTTKNTNATNANIKPSQILQHLNEYVIGQDYAKKVLAVAVYNHMKQLNNYDDKKASIKIEKSNILMVGPSGCGKTHLIKSLARLFKVPYAIADATTLTESGYVGADVETILQMLLDNANGDVKKAERGIVFIDEIDKKAKKAEENNSITRDVSGEGVQQALLKLIEGNKVQVQLCGERMHPYAETLTIDTSKILFIVGGAFPGIERLIAKRVHAGQQRTVGLALEEGKSETTESTYNELITQVTQDDFRRYGLIPEFIGRLPIICPLQELSRNELKDILTKPKNALVKQYKKMLAYDNVTLSFTDTALDAIVDIAIKKKTGARGLRSILEQTLLDTMFNAPDMGEQDKHKVVVTDEIVLQKNQKVLKPENKVA